MRVAAVKTESYDRTVMLEAVRRHFAVMKVTELVRPGMQVVLKPNLLMKRAPGEATTTSPALVEAVALCLRELGVEDITIADSPGGPYTKALLEGIYKTTGMSEAAERSGAKLNTGTGYREVSSCTLDGVCSHFQIIDPVATADLVINLPKWKTHAMTTMSAGVKNLLGYVPGLQKPELHFRFPDRAQFGRMLVELCETVRPQLTIVDAVVSMEGDGPSGGTPKETGWTFSARDIHALDFALAHLMGLEPQEVPTLAWAMERGLCSPSLEDIVFLEDGMPTDISPFQKPKSHTVDFASWAPAPLRGIVRRAGTALLVPKPAIRKRECVGCGKCAESCPAHTIKMAGKKAEILYKNCIKCYCCHEMCPVRAIAIRRRKLLDF